LEGHERLRLLGRQLTANGQAQPLADLAALAVADEPGQQQDQQQRDDAEADRYPVNIHHVLLSTSFATDAIVMPSSWLGAPWPSRGAYTVRETDVRNGYSMRVRLISPGADLVDAAEPPANSARLQNGAPHSPGLPIKDGRSPNASRLESRHSSERCYCLRSLSNSAPAPA